MDGSDDRQEPESFIKNSQLLTGLFGYWPDFHDAEILTLTLSVGCAQPWIPGCESPFMDMRVRLCDWNGKTADTLIEMQFTRVQKIEFSNFSYQNSVSELVFELKSRQFSDGRGGLSVPFDFICMEIFANCGVAGSLECGAVEVISISICGEAGSGTSS